MAWHYKICFTISTITKGWIYWYDQQNKIQSKKYGLFRVEAFYYQFMLGTKEIKATFVKDLKIIKWKELQQVSLKLLVKAFIWLEHVSKRFKSTSIYTNFNGYANYIFNITNGLHTMFLTFGVNQNVSNIWCKLKCF